ncbi:beta-ketoacyl-[acyl-carrier-protein] synthase II, partial [Paenibacillus sepulcri]|nr:beta-ketoacyl-[acyl-carrier-protein] synthase II [Paenibacillus sepulcri]
MEQVVITGMGLISPLGNDVNTFWGRMKQGQSGITLIDTFDVSRHKSKIAGLVRDFDADGRFGRKEARRMDRFCQFALAAAEQAVEDAGIKLDAVDLERMGVYVGSGIGGIQ